MDELRGPTIQVVLHVKEGLGFGFLRTPFIVSGSLNGYMLETDPVVPCHAPVFDAELVWEADKRRFRSLRVQNVPIKVEVFTVGTQGRKDKIGYLLLSLLGAQPCPSNKIIDVKHTWHRLLGVRSEGKCCQPQLLLSLTIEDRVNTITPRNELRMFHSNEVAYPTGNPAGPTAKSMLFTLNEYLEESKKTVSCPELQPQLICDQGLIQIGAGKQLFVLSIVIGSVENLESLLPEAIASKEIVDCYFNYSVFTHNITTDRVNSSRIGSSIHVPFNQRTLLRIRSDLPSLAQYFASCPHLVAKLCAIDTDVGICSLDLRKLIPTEDVELFLSSFCNTENGLAVHERCFMLRFEDRPDGRDTKRPYVDLEITLKYLGVQEKKPTQLTARSAIQLKSDRKTEANDALDCKSGSCTNLDRDVGGVAYTNMGVCNTARYKNASGDAMLQTNDIAEMIRKMYESFQESQEKLIASRLRPVTSDMQIQCEPPPTLEDEKENEPVRLETSKSDTCISQKEKEVKENLSFSAIDRDSLIRKYVDELEDWKERQQEMYKAQLKRKEEYHLSQLSAEWSKHQCDLERRLACGVEQCRRLAGDLTAATEDFRLRGYRNCDREKKLLEAKKALEAHYTAKYQELRLASQKMEDDMNHQLKLKDMRIEELEIKVQQLDEQIAALKKNLKNSEKGNDAKYSGLTKDQTASLIQELRCLEEKLDSAVQSKAFFKEQWGRAVRELHVSKLRARTHMLRQLHSDRTQLHPHGLEPIPDEHNLNQSEVDIKKLKDDFYVDLLANSPGLDSHSIISNTGPNGLEMYEFSESNSKNPLNEKLTDLIGQRDQLIQQDSPDEGQLKQLNHEIRNLLLNCGT